MAASYQVDKSIGFDVIDGSGQSGPKSGSPRLPRFIDRISHASTKRLRFSVSPGLSDPDNFERHLKTLDGVESVRFNRWACCFVVVFAKQRKIDALQWLSSLPQNVSDIPHSVSIPKTALIFAITG